MYLKFAWRYFKAKKSANAINIIAWVTTGVIAFATCCQVLVLSVYNGFEELVKSLYSSFYTDLKVVPSKGKTFTLSQADIQKIKSQPYIAAMSMIAEDKAILQSYSNQTFVNLKGVDSNYYKVSGLPHSLISGNYNPGILSRPGLIIGSGIQNAIDVSMNPAFENEDITVTLPKTHVTSDDPIESMSEGFVTPNGVFSIQQEFDNNYAITNIDFAKRQMNYRADEYSAAEIKLKDPKKEEEARKMLNALQPGVLLVKSRYEQNSNLYNTIRLEKWAIYAVLTLILLIAAFNMVSALTMLVLEKKKDISILQSMGANRLSIQKIFLSEGLLLGFIGSAAGILIATIICVLQLNYKLIKMQGGTFLIDYFPVKLIPSDFILVGLTAMLISFLASWAPAWKASRQAVNLK